jgi:hypothetical protein
MERIFNKIEQVLMEHEIHSISFHATPTGHKLDGYWVPIATCRCGYTSPPEHRTLHLASVINSSLKDHVADIGDRPAAVAEDG